MPSLSAQNNLLRGMVTYRNSGSKPIEGVKISSFGTNAVYSNSSGLFELKFASKTAGDKVTLIVQKTGMDIVNTHDLEEVYIRKNPDDFIRVVVCKSGEREQHALQYYDIITNNINRKFTSKLNSINKKLDLLNETSDENAEEKKIFLDKIKQLEEERDKLLNQAESLAKRLADTDLDQASKLAKEAFKHFENGDIKKAIETLDDESLDQALETAVQEREKAQEKLFEAENAIQQSIDNYLTKAKFCIADSQFEEAEKNYEKAISADTTNYWNIKSFAGYLNGQNQYEKAIIYYHKALLLANTDYQTASILTSLGTVYRRKNDFTQALTNCKSALEIRKKLIENDSYFKKGMSGDIAMLLGNMAIIYTDLKDFKNAEKCFEEAIPFFREEAEKHPYTGEKADLAINLNNLGTMYHEQKKYASAGKQYKEALAIWEELAQKFPDDYLHQVARVRHNLGVLDFNRYKYDSALLHLKEALGIRKDMAQKNRQQALPLVGETLNNFPLLFNAMGEYDQALKYAEEFLQLNLELETQHPKTFTKTLAIAYLMKGKIYKSKKDYSQAIHFYEKGREIYKPLTEAYPQTYLPDYSSFVNELGNIYRLAQQKERAAEIFQSVIDLQKQLKEPLPNDYKKSLANAYNKLGEIRSDARDFEPAIQFLSKALTLKKELAKENPNAYLTTLGDILIDFGLLYRRMQDFPASINAYEEALKIRKSLALENPDYWNSFVASNYYNLALVWHEYLKFEHSKENYEQCISAFQEAKKSYAQQRDNPEALKWKNRSAEYLQKLNHPDYAAFLSASGKISDLIRQGREKLAQTEKMPIRQKMVKILEKEMKRNQGNSFIAEELATSYGNLAWTQLFLRKFKEAETSSRKGLENDSTQVWINTNLALSLLLQGKYEAAESVYISLKDVLYSDGVTPFRTIFLEDLDALEKEGISHPDFQKIRMKLK